MVARGRQKHAQAQFKTKCLRPYRDSVANKIWALLIFLFFAASPLVFFSGFDSQGQLNFTVYDFPKVYFVAVCSLFLIGCYFLYLLFHPEDVKSLNNFFCYNSWIKLFAALLFLMALSLVEGKVIYVGFFVFGQYIILGIFFIVLAQLFKFPGFRWVAVYGLLAALIIFTPLGIAQFFGYKIPFLMPILGPASTFGYRNPAAHFIVLVLPFVIFAIWRHWRLWREKGAILQLSIFSGFLVLALASLNLLFMNYSRTAIMALLGEALLLPVIWVVSNRGWASGHLSGYRHWGRALAGVLVLMFIISALIMVFPQSRKRIERSFNKFKQGGVVQLLEFRYYHWLNTLAMIKENPILGVGVGNWRFTYPLYYKSFAKDPLVNYRTQVRKVHNDYLQLAAECGIPALLFFLVLWGRQFYLLRYSTVADDDEEDWRLPLAASLLVFSVIMFFSFPMQMAYSRMFCFFLLALGEARAWPALSS